ncbi:phycobilisome rod-core linker polypeptide [Myxacorys almedinensis]|uniref:Phycobilisome rod-core linker polypeptide CpcG2 n=1 Tax=Myxacorys almedinensis A TaxID=2690445 RepID=A0A8J7Z5F0_9CYAN|nr:phycobilisome rod-core linker polypeptide [Myxacorys almedinensis]NDJ18191.1 phycobilisome rod-core linker polypeptide CpcG2 [Myxacorys almedinensis A]
MALPLLDYKPTTQNHRVSTFGKADRNEDAPYIYRIEEVGSSTEMEALIWACYRQVFSEHETLKFNRQITSESRLRNGVTTVRGFIAELAKSSRFYSTVVEVNNNYRLVQICLKRFLGRDSYNKDEEIAWSIKIATKGFDGFVDELLSSEEYTMAFGDYTVPYQRRRMEGRPFNLVTPRYGEDFRASAGTVKTDWQFVVSNFSAKKFQERQLAEGDPRRYRDMAASVSTKGNYAQSVSASSIDYLNKVPRRR